MSTSAAVLCIGILIIEESILLSVCYTQVLTILFILHIDQFRQFLLDNMEYAVLADITLHQQINS